MQGKFYNFKLHNLRSNANIILHRGKPIFFRIRPDRTGYWISLIFYRQKTRPDLYGPFHPWADRPDAVQFSCPAWIFVHPLLIVWIVHAPLVPVLSVMLLLSHL